MPTLPAPVLKGPSDTFPDPSGQGVDDHGDVSGRGRQVERRLPSRLSGQLQLGSACPRDTGLQEQQRALHCQPRRRRRSPTFPIDLLRQLTRQRSTHPPTLKRDPTGRRRPREPRAQTEPQHQVLRSLQHLRPRHPTAHPHPQPGHPQPREPVLPHRYARVRHDMSAGRPSPRPEPVSGRLVRLQPAGPTADQPRVCEAVQGGIDGAGALAGARQWILGEESCDLASGHGCAGDEAHEGVFERRALAPDRPDRARGPRGAGGYPSPHGAWHFLRIVDIATVPGRGCEFVGHVRDDLRCQQSVIGQWAGSA